MRRSIIGLLVVAHHQLPAQVRVPAAPSCSACALTWRRVATLGDTAGPGALPRWANSAARDSRGRVILTLEPPGGAPLVYDATGAFIGAVGRVGAGPNEYQRPVPVLVTPGDTLRIFDGATGRLSLVAPTLAWVRSHPTALFGASIVAVGADRLVAISSFSPDQATVLTLAGEALHRIRLGPTPPDQGSRRVGGSAQAAFWVGLSAAPTLARWTLAGQRERALTLTGWWVPSRARPGTCGMVCGEKPVPQLAAINEDRAGRLWLAILVARADWERGLGPRQRGPKGRAYHPQLDATRVLETVIAVIDPERATLEALGRAPGKVRALLGEGAMTVERVGPDGSLHLEVWESRVSRAKPGSA